MRVPDYFDMFDADEEGEQRDPRPPRCNRCGSADVRWRQQTGKWVLFSLQPGVVHECSKPNLDAFDEIKE